MQPPGRQLMTTFNHQGSVLIGGKKEGARLSRPFHGVIAGQSLHASVTTDRQTDIQICMH